MSAFADIDLDDYLLDPGSEPWGVFLEPFSPPLPKTFDLFLVTRFLDFFLIFPDGSVNWLDPNSAAVRRVAASRAEFEALMEEHYESWLMTPLVDAAAARGLRPGRGEAYYLKAPPVLGGDYSIGNVAVGPIDQTLLFLADMMRQLSAAPEGATIRIEVTP